MCKSAAVRRSQRLNAWCEVSITQRCAWAACSSAALVAKAWSKVTGPTVAPAVEQATVTRNVVSPRGGSATWSLASLPVSVTSAGVNSSRDWRTMPSSPSYDRMTAPGSTTGLPGVPRRARRLPRTSKMSAKSAWKCKVKTASTAVSP
jgi:hypothetical protein